MKRKIICMALASLLMLGSGTFAYAHSGAATEPFKVVGYYSGDLFNEPVAKLQTDKMTHIMYAFLIPNDDGTVKPLEKPEQLAAVTEKAHRDGAKVYIALGGWSYDGKPLAPVFETVGADDGLRTALVKNVTAFTLDNGLDGVEVDWEYPNADTVGSYEKLVVELSAALKKKGKSLTAAVNGAWSATAGPGASKLMTDKCLDSFEFISVMGYDMNNQEHSPLWFGNTSMDYWLNRGVPPERIVLGMPLYGRPSWMQYRDLVSADPNNAYKDYVQGTPNDSYYNGINTLREKTRIALQKAGGVMLFDVNEDVDFNDTATGKYSAVTMIDGTVQSMKGMGRSEIKDYVTVVIDNQVLEMSGIDRQGMAFIDENDRTMLPMRKLLEAIGAEIMWNGDSRQVTAVRGGITVTAKIGDSFITVDGQEIPMDTKAVIKENRTYLPARAVLSAFGYTMRWSGISKTVYANS